jgi:hypothetical protein
MKITLFLMAIALIFYGCNSTKIVSDYDKTTDFTKYKTYQYYGWAEESDKILNRFDKERIEKSFGEEFKKRGLTYVESDGDLIVTLFVVVNNKTEMVAHTDNMGYYGGRYGYGPGYGYGTGYSTTTVSEYNYKEGTLIIDVFDAKSKLLIWECASNKVIEEDPANREQNIRMVVNYMMQRYPVKPLPESK